LIKPAAGRTTCLSAEQDVLEQEALEQEALGQKPRGRGVFEQNNLVQKPPDLSLFRSKTIGFRT
jgi:hypothetical protein